MTPTNHGPGNPDKLRLIPPDIVAAARRVSDWFEQNNIQEWKICGCRNRYPEHAPQPAAAASSNPVVTIIRGSTTMGGKEQVVVRWEAGAASLPDGVHTLYAGPCASPAQDASIYHAANRCVDAAVQHLTGSTQWPDNWMALRDQFVSFMEPVVAFVEPADRTRQAGGIDLLKAARCTSVSCGPDRLYELRFEFDSLAKMQVAHRALTSAT